MGLGLSSLAAIVLLLDLGPDTDLFGIGQETRVAAGLACLAGPVAYLLVCLFRIPVRFRKWRLDPPSPGLAMAQIGIGTVNFACVAAAIHQLMAVFGEITYFEVAGAYVTANVASLISHVPGGLGVLEATMLGIIPGAKIIGALVAFRVLYFFVPLMIGLPTFLASEAYYRRRPDSFSKHSMG
ncbi:Inner membrane protein YbhN [compost metagenome]